MNKRLLHGLLIFAITTSAVLGCAGPNKRNPALYSGGPSSLTSATQDAIDNSDTSNGMALGSLKPSEKTTAADRLLAPFKSVGNSLKSQPIDERTQDPLSLNNAVEHPTPELFLSAARVIAGGGNLENARALYKQALIAHPNDRDSLLELARIEVQMKEYESATDRYMKAVEAHPDDPIVFNDLGLFHSEQGNWDLAVKAFTRAIELDGERKLYRNNLANAWVQAGRPDLALEQLAAVHEKPQAHYNLGYLLYNAKQFIPAVEQFELAYQADQRFTDAIMMRNQLLDELQRSQPQSPAQMVRPAAFEDSASAEKPNVVQTAAVEDKTAGQVAADNVAADSVAAGNVAVAVANEAPTQKPTIAPAAPAHQITLSERKSPTVDAEVSPRIIVLRGRDTERGSVVSTRLSDIADVSPSPKLAPIADSSTSADETEADVQESESEANKVFVRYEKNWMPMGFYTAVELSRAAATPEEKKQYWNGEDTGNAPAASEPHLLKVEEQELKPVQEEAPAVLKPTTGSTPRRPAVGETIFERRRTTPQYYPTTGAPAITPKND